MHPETGQRGLLVNPVFTSHIEGLSRLESDAYLGLLYAHITLPEHVVRWRWRSGDVAFWDNRATSHYAAADYHGTRVMYLNHHLRRTALRRYRSTRRSDGGVNESERGRNSC